MPGAAPCATRPPWFIARLPISSGAPTIRWLWPSPPRSTASRAAPAHPARGYGHCRRPRRPRAGPPGGIVCCYCWRTPRVCPSFESSVPLPQGAAHVRRAWRCGSRQLAQDAHNAIARPTPTRKAQRGSCGMFANSIIIPGKSYAKKQLRSAPMSDPQDLTVWNGLWFSERDSSPCSWFCAGWPASGLRAIGYHNPLQCSLRSRV